MKRLNARYTLAALVKLRWLSIPLAITGGLHGCGNEPAQKASIHDSAPGLIQEPSFTTNGEHLVRPWWFSQHASTDSYEYDIQGARFWIKRVGEEPWGKLSQRIPVSELAGAKALRFSIEAQGSLNHDWGEALEPTGVGISIWGHENTHRETQTRPSLVTNKRIELEPGDLTSQWQRYEACVVLPAEVSRLEFSVVLSLGGELGVRRPSLTPVSMEDCA